MDSRFWTAFFAGTLLHSSIINMLMGNVGFAIVLAAIGLFEIYMYGALKDKEESNGDD